jgi:hypothetical protein
MRLAAQFCLRSISESHEAFTLLLPVVQTDCCRVQICLKLLRVFFGQAGKLPRLENHYNAFVILRLRISDAMNAVLQFLADRIGLV